MNTTEKHNSRYYSEKCNYWKWKRIYRASKYDEAIRVLEKQFKNKEFRVVEGEKILEQVLTCKWFEDYEYYTHYTLTSTILNHYVKKKILKKIHYPLNVVKFKFAKIIDSSNYPYYN